MKYVINVPDFDKYSMPSPTKGRVVAVPIMIGDITFNIPTEMAFIKPYTEPVNTYTKADYIMALHKEYGCTLTMAEEAHNKALEHLRSKARMKG